MLFFCLIKRESCIAFSSPTSHSLALVCLPCQNRNHQPNVSNMTMNNWTISRRIIAGFITMLLITVALGVFALWRLTGLAQDIAYLADNTLPSVLLLGEVGSRSRDNLISLLQIDEAGSAERKRNSSSKSLPTGPGWTNCSRITKS